LARTGNVIKTLITSIENTDNITGITLEERAKLVLLTLGDSPAKIREAFRRLAKRHHPDKMNGDKEKFQLVNEAYELLTKGTISKRPLLADDRLVIRLIGRQVEPLINRQKEWEEYERWRRYHFYGIGAL